MHNLSGVFMKLEPCPNALIEGKIFYLITLNFPNKSRMYYFDRIEEQKTWVKHIRNSVKQDQILEAYEIKVFY